MAPGMYTISREGALSLPSTVQQVKMDTTDAFMRNLHTAYQGCFDVHVKKQQTL